MILVNYTPEEAAQLVLLTEALCSVSTPTEEDYDTVWTNFMWTAGTLFAAHNRNYPDPALQLERQMMTRIMHAWGLDPDRHDHVLLLDDRCRRVHVRRKLE